MTHTYSDALSSDRDKIRFRIGDTVQGAGPRPDRRNFSDNEIAFVLSDEGGVTAAIAHLFEVLASEWESFSISETEDKVSYDAKEKAADYDKRANIWRAKPDGGDSSGTIKAGVIAFDFQQDDD